MDLLIHLHYLESRIAIRHCTCLHRDVIQWCCSLNVIVWHPDGLEWWPDTRPRLV